jgi:hypothetical protein
MLSVIMLSDIKLSVIKLNVIKLSVMVAFEGQFSLSSSRQLKMASNFYQLFLSRSFCRKSFEMSNWNVKTHISQSGVFTLNIFPTANRSVSKWARVFVQGILKGEISLYHWPPVWLVRNQLYDNGHFFIICKTDFI